MKLISMSETARLLASTLPQELYDDYPSGKWECIRNNGVLKYSKSYKIKKLLNNIERNKSNIEKSMSYNTISAVALRDLCTKSLIEYEAELLALEQSDEDDFEGNWKCVYEIKE